MPLDSGGRVLLKIYNHKGQLLISRPCTDREFAEKWFIEYAEKWKEVYPELTCNITEMVPRI